MWIDDQKPKEDGVLGRESRKSGIEPLSSQASTSEGCTKPKMTYIQLVFSYDSTLTHVLYNNCKIIDIYL